MGLQYLRRNYRATDFDAFQISSLAVYIMNYINATTWYNYFIETKLF